VVRTLKTRWLLRKSVCLVYNMLLYRAYAISDYPAVSVHAAAIMHMIMNNLDSRVAQFPQELVTYGGNGQVFSNWAQASHTHHRQWRRYTRAR